MTGPDPIPDGTEPVDPKVIPPAEPDAGASPPEAPEDAGASAVVRARSNSDVERAFVDAAAVIHALAENQRALRGTMERAERTELLLKNVSGLNETFRAVADTQERLLRTVEDSERRREQAERRSRRARAGAFLLAVGLLGAAAVALFAVSRALDSAGAGSSVGDALRVALQDDAARRSEDRRLEMAELSVAFRDALADRKAYEAQLDETTQRARSLEDRMATLGTESGAASAELEETRRKLAEAMRQIDEYQSRVSDGEAGIRALVEQIELRQRNEGPLVAPLLPSAPAAPEAEYVPVGSVGPGGTVAADAAPLAPAVAGLTPLSDALTSQLNAMLSWGSTTSLRLVMAGGRVGSEVRDAYFHRYDDRGNPAGSVHARTARIEESLVEPRITLVLADGYEATGRTRVPYASRRIEIRGVDPEIWRSRIPELLDRGMPPFPAIDAPGIGPSAAPAGAESPEVAAVLERLNALLARHTEYARLRFRSIVAIEGELLRGVVLESLVQVPESREPRVDQILRAQRAKLRWVAVDRRLELDLEEGTRGRDLPVAFPAGRLRYVFPGVDRGEVVGGDVSLPIGIQ